MTQRGRRATKPALVFLVLAAAVGGSAEAAVVAAGQAHTAVVASGEVWSWGDNDYGQIGDGTQVARPLPTKALGLNDAVAVTTGWHHTLAITSTGAVVAWGLNSEGMLGDGTQTSRNAPVAVATLSGIVGLAAGRYHSVALRSDGTVWTWGSNTAGQLGDGTTAPQLTAVQVTGLSGVVAVGAGDFHTLALKKNGQVYAWGLNTSGQLGDGTLATRLSPVPVAEVSAVAAISAGLNHSVFLEWNGTLWSTGANGSGQLGDGSALSRSVPDLVPGLYTVVAVAAGGAHTVARLEDGTAWAWGANSAGELGDGTALSALVPTRIADLPDVPDLAAGFGGQNVAVTADHAVWGWGHNDYGQVGDGTRSNRHEPVKISEPGFDWKVGTPVFDYPPAQYTTELNVALSSATPSAVIRYTTDGTEPQASSPVYFGAPLAVGVSKTIKAFASRASRPDSNVARGQYSFQAATPAFSPAEGTYTSPQDVTISTTSPGITLRFTTEGSEPTASSTAYTTPVPVDTLTTLKAAGFRTGWDQGRTGVAAYSFNFGTLAAPTADPASGAYPDSLVVTLAAAPGATIRYTTDDSDPADTSPLYTGPITLTASATVRAKAWKTDWTASAVASTAYTLQALAPTLTPGGGAYSIGQTITLVCATPGATLRYTLDGSDPTTNDPAVPSGTTIFAGDFTLKAKAWATGIDPSPVASASYSISGAPGTGSAAGGGTHSLVLASSGTVWAWGGNSYGQVGDGTTTSPIYEATPVAGLGDAVAVAAGLHHSLALKSDGTVWGWGDNDHGELGDGTSGNFRTRPVPVLAVSGFTSVVAIAAGQHHSLAVTGDGKVWSWGHNIDGQLGDGTTASRSAPVQVSGLTGAVGVAAGTSHSVAVRQDGTVVAWGLNTSGQLGDGTTTSPRTTPASVLSLSGITAVSAGQSHTLARMTDGSTWAWGYNGYGQLGDSSYAASSTPVEVWGVNGTTVPRSGVDALFSLALQGDGVVRAWGDNAYGQLGNGSGTGSNVELSVQGLPEVVAVAGGSSHALAVAQDGSVWGWGGNGSAQVGDGTTVNRSLPVRVADAGFAWRAATPVISPASGTYAEDQTVSITTATSGGTIRYTTDGSEPTDSSPAYSGSFPVSIPTTVKAKTFRAGLSGGATAVSAHAFKVATPSLSPPGGAFDAPQDVTVSCSTPAVTLRYTRNGLDPTTGDPTVTPGGGVAVNVTQTLKVKAWRSGWDTSDTETRAFTLQVATPEFSPPGGSFTSAPSVMVSTTSPGSTIRYTTNGLEPTETDPTVSSGGKIVVGASTTLKAKAFREGWTPSVAASELYMLDLPGVATPAFSPAPGTYTTAKTVKATTSTSGAVIRYTLDGAEPSPSSPIFARPLRVDATTTIKARAYGADRSASAVGTATYTIHSGTVAAPALSVAAGVYTTSRTVTIRATRGAEIHYTTNGADPTTSDPLIASGSSIGVDRALIVKAAAWKNGRPPSPVTRRDYVITGAVAAGAHHSVALKADGSVWAWGDNGYGQIGDGTSGTSRVTAVPVSGLTSGVVAIAAGAHHSLALRADGSVVGWGYNYYGQVGDGTSGNDRTSPVQVSGLASGVVAIAAGVNHSLALKSDGSVVAWGSNDQGQVGDGTSGNDRTSPVPVSGLTSDVVGIAGGLFHSVVLKSDGSVVAWGSNTYGQLGVPGTSQSLTPVAIPNLSAVSAVFAGPYVSLCMRGLAATSGDAWGWGSNDNGQIGDGTSGTDRAAPVRGPSSVFSLSAGEGHVLAAGRDGSVWGWGGNTSGQLGLGTTSSNVLRAARVNSLLEALAVAAGTSHSLALMAEGTVRGWGYNGGGQVGDGSTDLRTEPQLVADLVLATNGWLLQDTDTDGLSNVAEYRLGSDPLSADTNGDGVPDGAAAFSNLSVTAADADGDGLWNADELTAGTDPFRADSDGDGAGDGQDCYPLDPTKTTCGTPDPNDHTPPVITLTEPPSAVPVP